MGTYVAIFLGGGLGSLLRFSISRFVKDNIVSVFPWGTLIANLLATFLLGFLVFQFSHKISFPAQLKAPIMMGLTVGFCGGFSTFSTFSLETFELIRMKYYILATLNVLVSVLAGFAVLFIALDKQVA